MKKSVFGWGSGDDNWNGSKKGTGMNRKETDVGRGEKPEEMKKQKLNKNKQIKLFVDKLREECQARNNCFFEFRDLLLISKSLDMKFESDFSKFLDKLNQENYLILKQEPKKGYQFNLKY